MRLSYFFSKKECILAILEGLIFKIFSPVGPNHGGASLVTEPQPPQSRKIVPQQIPPWVGVRVWLRVRVGGQSSGRQFSRGRFSMYRVKCTKALAEFPFFHGEFVNLTISQQQLQLFI